MQEVNDVIADAASKLNVRDAVALMGSHTLMMPQACTTDDAAGTADLNDRTCGGQGGNQRLFWWDSSWYRVLALRFTVYHANGCGVYWVVPFFRPSPLIIYHSNSFAAGWEVVPLFSFGFCLDFSFQLSSS